MPTDAALRLSLYLTLALACACIGYAEHDLFPEVPFIAGAAVVALGVLYRLETRVQLLSIPEANRLGLVLGLVYFAWAAARIVKVLRSEELANANFQFVLVALFGPLLMVAMPAKLARREKHVGDYWTLHAVGLAAAVLSGAMAEEPVVFVLIGLYAAAALWNLSLLYLRRAAGWVAHLPNRPPPPPVADVVTDAPPRFGLRRALLFTAAGAAVGLPLYLVTPRSRAEKLELGKPRIEVGYAATQMIDLNQTGELRANPAPAFEVVAERDGKPVTDLSPGQRWRGLVLRRYAGGVWRHGEILLPAVEAVPRRSGPWEFPGLGPGQATLTFAVPSDAQADPANRRPEFLAEPVLWVPNQSPPVASMTADGPRPWHWVADGSFYSDFTPRRGSPHTYVQAWRADADPDLSPPFRLVDPEWVLRDRIGLLVHAPVPRAKEYADGLIAKMVADGKLPANHFDPVSRLPRREFHDRIARAFSAHLATSPEFVYTTSLRRERKDLDPIEEFLFHTKAGHCERFASALAVLLRTQGIPALLVLGFKGCESTDEPGRYVVRQEHAHAWVQALIIEFEPAKPGTRPLSRWRVLDPTPAGEPAAADPAGGWARGARAWISDMFREYVVNYTPEQRRRALAALWSFLSRWDVLASVAAAALAVAAARRVLRRWRAGTPADEPATPGFFGRLVAVLAPHGFAPQPGETAREFAAAVADALGRNPATAAVARVPIDWAEAYYETRFGDRPLPPDRLADLEGGLHELTRSLPETGNWPG